MKTDHSPTAASTSVDLPPPLDPPVVTDLLFNRPGVQLADKVEAARLAGERPTVWRRFWLGSPQHHVDPIGVEMGRLEPPGSARCCVRVHGRWMHGRTWFRKCTSRVSQEYGQAAGDAGSRRSSLT